MRDLEVAAGPELDRDLAENILRRQVPFGRSDRAGLQTKGVCENLLEANRTRLADRGPSGLRGQRPRIGDDELLQIRVHEEVHTVAHDGTGECPPELRARECGPIARPGSRQPAVLDEGEP